jgi:ribosomal protein S12 methylthiotransferase
VILRKYKKLKIGIKPTDTVLIITLGCSKNTVDSERLMYQLSANSLKVEFNKENSKADIVIINTCGFVKDAKQESIDTILHFAEKKKRGRINKLYVIGCLSELYKNVLKKEIPEVDQYFGTSNLLDIIESLGYRYYNKLFTERTISTPVHYSFLKISEGCNRKCSFCTIPLIKGPYISFPVENLIEETTLLAKKGVKELNIIAQDISYYGYDIYHSRKLPYLLEKLSEIDGIEWIRLHYAYPSGFPKELIKVINTNPKICKYIDIPFQHISDKMLKIMHRGINKFNTLKLIDLLRTGIDNLNIRTTLIVGHPGESDEDFKELLEFVSKTRFERLGVFIYSHEEGTYNYKHYMDHIPTSIKQRRVKKIMKIQKAISDENNQKYIGKQLKVLVDSFQDGSFYGRTEFDSPEIDNEVIITPHSSIKVGQFFNVEITNALEYDLIGSIGKS